jgi:hypothetical protein
LREVLIERLEGVAPFDLHPHGLLQQFGRRQATALQLVVEVVR